MRQKASTPRFALAVASVAFISASCSSGSDVNVATVEDGYTGADGVTSATSDTARIITLSGDLTELVFSLGAGGSVVATDLTTVHPAEAISLPTIGVGRFLSAEAVLKHDPSLVIGDTQTSPQAAVDQIRAAGVPVIIMDVSTTFNAMYRKIDDLGGILGLEDAAAALRSRLQGEIEAASTAREPIGTQPKAAYVYTRGPDVMLLFGDGMVTHPVIEASGAQDAGSAAGVKGSVDVTPEALIAAAPDVIIVPAEGLEILGGIEGLLSIPGIAETPAGINNRILAYPEGDFLTMGPRIARSIEGLSADLFAMNAAP